MTGGGLVNRDDGWRLPDHLWQRIEPLLPEPPAHPLGCHRPRVPNRNAMDAILLVRRTGMRWNALAVTGICSSSSAHRRYQEWERAGVFAAMHRLGLLESALGGDGARAGGERFSRTRDAGQPQPIVLAGASTSTAPSWGSPAKKS